MPAKCPKDMTDHKGGADHRYIVVTGRDRRLLGYVARFRLMSRDQVMALAPFGSLTRANTRLAALVRAGLLARKLLPVYPGRGSVQALYHLGKLSRGIVNAEPSFVERQVRQIARWDSRQTAHVVTANQVVVDFLAALDRSDGANADLRTETELRQMFHDRPLVPDGWLAWTHDGKRFNAFVEADLATEGLGAWRRKVVNYLQYAESDAHAEHFGLRSFRVLVVAGSCQRLRHLREVSESAGRLFLFAQMRGVNRKSFFDPIWLPAKGAHPITLAEA